MRDSPAIDIAGLWVRRTRFHEPAMQDPSKGADELPQKGFAKRGEKGRKRRVEKKRQNPQLWLQKGGRGSGASSLVNAGFRAHPSSEREKM